MFSHVNVGARDLLRLAAFYDAVLAPLGLARAAGGTIGGQSGLLWRHPGQRWPQFCVQVSFAAPSRGAVDAARQAALANGGTDEGAPGLRERYAPDFYGAYCRDPEGNKLCFVHADGLWTGGAAP